MAKAYLSYTDRPLARVDAAYRSDLRSANILADLAALEVQRIMLDTEPRSQGWGFLPFPTAHTRSYIAQDGSIQLSMCGFPENAKEALAEALAKFIELEISE